MNTTLKNAIGTALVFLSATQMSIAQNSHVINLKELTEQTYELLLQTAPKDGWVLVNTNEGNFILNLSNKDYQTRFSINCVNNAPPSFMIEYSDQYEDGEYGGIDFTSSDSEDHAALNFIIDGKTYKNPFTASEAANFNTFLDALVAATSFEIACYQFEYNPETDEQDLKLNRTIKFQSKHGELLREKVTCD